LKENLLPKVFSLAFKPLIQHFELQLNAFYPVQRKEFRLNLGEFNEVLILLPQWFVTFKISPHFVPHKILRYFECPSTLGPIKRE